MTIAKQILKFNENIALIDIELPAGIRIINPFKGEQSKLVKKIAFEFYQKFYNDTNKRRLILGIEPSRFWTAIIPFLINHTTIT